MAKCGATATNHCCWIGGEVCSYFDAGGLAEGRDGACTLRTELGSWAAVHRDPRYLRDVKARVPSFARYKTYNCGNYPTKGITCGECGVSG
jgi:hypothetical protein